MSALRATVRPMVSGMITSLAGDDPDVAYLCASVSQAIGAIALAEAQISYGHDERAKTIAREMILAKYGEIAAILSLLESRDLR
jgi:uncharacterized protein (DUF305 family)